MTQDQKRFEKFTRRGLFKYFAGIATGWFVTTFLTPIRRWVVSLIAATPLGRRAKLVFGYTDHIEGDLSNYTLQISNSGGEAAENITVRVGYEEKIQSVTLLIFQMALHIRKSHMKFQMKGCVPSILRY